MLKINFEDVPGFSKQFCDFLKKTSFFSERFIYEDNLFQNDSFIQSKLKNYLNRHLFNQIVQKSNSILHLSNKQKENLSLLQETNTLVVTTGQQPGYLGGPLYTLYKTFTAIRLAEKLADRYPSYNFVPLFWIEDNDHDCIEAFQTVLFDRLGEIIEVPVDKACLKGWKKPVSELYLSDDHLAFFEAFLNLSSSQSKNSNVAYQFKEIYSTEKSLSKSFQRILNYFFSDAGLLFISAKECRINNAFSEILSKEFESFGASFSIIETSNHLIESQGYHIQAKNSLPNIFYHSEEQRTKVEWKSQNRTFVLGNIEIPDKEILQFFEKESTNFSPNVLLRPICQEYILPNIASVLGPSEIGYTTQLKELFEWYQIHMPAIVPRHSISILKKEHSSLFENYGFTFFSRNRREIEDELFNKNRNLELLKKIEKIENQFIEAFEDLKNLGASIDKSLLTSGEAHFQKSFKPLKSYISKIYSAEKRNILNKYKELLSISNFLFPKNTLQERIVSLILPSIIFDEREFFEKIENVTNQTQTHHYIIYL
jgi:bacillithiol biosynthesis cysteine-adding enzyme BshC